MKVKVKKLYAGCIEIRDYLVKKAVKEGEAITVEYGGKVMTIPYFNLSKGTKTITQHSRFNDETYYLIAYKWKPD